MNCILQVYCEIQFSNFCQQPTTASQPGEQQLHTRDSEGISELLTIQLTLPYKISCNRVSQEILLLSLLNTDQDKIDQCTVAIFLRSGGHSLQKQFLKILDLQVFRCLDISNKNLTYLPLSKSLGNIKNVEIGINKTYGCCLPGFPKCNGSPLPL